MLAHSEIMVLWVTLLISGYFYLRLAPLDPHNPAKLPGRYSRLAWSFLASTAMISAPFFEGQMALFLASLGVGTILTPGLNDPYHLKRSENPSKISRMIEKVKMSVSGTVLVKFLCFAIAWLATLIWHPIWAPLLTVIAGGSIAGRTHVLLSLGRSPSNVQSTLKEVFGNQIPPQLNSLSPENAVAIKKSSNRQIRKLFPPSLAETLIQSKKQEVILDWYSPSVVNVRMLYTIGCLIIWMSIAAGIVEGANQIKMDALNFNAAYGILAGVLVAPIFASIRQ